MMTKALSFVPSRVRKSKVPWFEWPSDMWLKDLPALESAAIAVRALFLSMQIHFLESSNEARLLAAFYLRAGNFLPAEIPLPECVHDPENCSRSVRVIAYRRIASLKPVRTSVKLPIFLFSTFRDPLLI